MNRQQDNAVLAQNVAIVESGEAVAVVGNGIWEQEFQRFAGDISASVTLPIARIGFSETIGDLSSLLLADKNFMTRVEQARKSMRSGTRFLKHEEVFGE